MNAKKCDRCGKFYEDTGVRREIMLGVDRHPYPYQWFDFCDECYELLKEFCKYITGEEENDIQEK